MDHFSFLAPVYEKFIPPPDQDEILPYLQPDVPPARLLDAGGGTGRVSGQLQSYFSQIVVADLNRSMLDRSAEKTGVIPVSSHIEKLPFPDNTFSRVLIVDALHHFCDQEIALYESVRVLTPGGRIVVGEPDIHKFGVKVVAFLEKLAFMRSHFLSPEKIAALIEGNGAGTQIFRDDSHSAWVVGEKE
ncbi:MAG: class I SAM-dependent methyltransferase [Candidatus Marinimicrobia bacterium]|nr:class I SAM-dependent methyltransferase [Candidatus Neomarinimicrobiota bacterium]